MEVIVLSWSTLFDDFYHIDYTEDGIKNFLDNNKDVTSGEIPSPIDMMEYSVQNFISMVGNTNTEMINNNQIVTADILMSLNRSNYSWVLYIITAIILFNIIKNTILRIISILLILIVVCFLLYYLYKGGYLL